jgi:NADH dehydrogenase
MVGVAPNIQILLGEVVDIDPKASEVVLNGQHLGYDQLIPATGSGSTYFGREEWRPLAPPMKILEHADEIRRRLLMALEEAEQTRDPSQRAFLQTVVVVGAGPAGCELAGSLIELMQRAAGRDFKQLRPEDCRVVLVDPVDRVLPTMAPVLSEAAAAYLRAAGVDLRLGLKVEGIAPGRVCLSGADGEIELEAATICWTAGVRATRLGKLLAGHTDCPVDRSGRLVVEPEFGSRPSRDPGGR